MKRFFKSKLIITLVTVVMLTGAIAVGLASHTLGQSHAAPSPRVFRNPGYAGYAAEGTEKNPIHYKTVYAVWNVAPITCAPKENSSSATWVGLSNGGNALEQIATVSECIDGSPHYSAVWEIIWFTSLNSFRNLFNPLSFSDSSPSPYTTIPISINAGNQVSAAVTSLGKGQFRLEIRNITTNVHQSVQAWGDPFSDANNVAECVQEDPSRAGSTVPFSHFDPVTIDCFVNTNTPIATAGTILWKYVMPKANTGVLTGDAFTVTWLKP